MINQIIAIAQTHGCYNRRMSLPKYRKALIIMKDDNMNAKNIRKAIKEITGKEISIWIIYKWFKGVQPKDDIIQALEHWYDERKYFERDKT